MSKLAIAVLIFRCSQAISSLVFLTFWSFLCAGHFPLGGGNGGYALGCKSPLSLVPLPTPQTDHSLSDVTGLLAFFISIHGIYSYARKQHLDFHRAVYHHTRWALDLLVVFLFTATITVATVAPRDFSYWKAHGGSDQSEAYVWGYYISSVGWSWMCIVTGLNFVITFILLAVSAARSKHDMREEKSAAMGYGGYSAMEYSPHAGVGMEVPVPHYSSV